MDPRRYNKHRFDSRARWPISSPRIISTTRPIITGVTSFSITRLLNASRYHPLMTEPATSYSQSSTCSPRTRSSKRKWPQRRAALTSRPTPRASISPAGCATRLKVQSASKHQPQAARALVRWKARVRTTSSSSTRLSGACRPSSSCLVTRTSSKREMRRRLERRLKILNTSAHLDLWRFLVQRDIRDPKIKPAPPNAQVRAAKGSSDPAPTPTGYAPDGSLASPRSGKKPLREALSQKLANLRKDKSGAMADPSSGVDPKSPAPAGANPNQLSAHALMYLPPLTVHLLNSYYDNANTSNKLLSSYLKHYVANPLQQARDEPDEEEKGILASMRERPLAHRRVDARRHVRGRPACVADLDRRMRHRCWWCCVCWSGRAQDGRSRRKSGRQRCRWRRWSCARGEVVPSAAVLSAAWRVRRPQSAIACTFKTMLRSSALSSMRWRCGSPTYHCLPARPYAHGRRVSLSLWTTAMIRQMMGVRKARRKELLQMVSASARRRSRRRWYQPPRPSRSRRQDRSRLPTRRRIMERRRGPSRRRDRL